MAFIGEAFDWVGSHVIKPVVHAPLDVVHELGSEFRSTTSSLAHSGSSLIKSYGGAVSGTVKAAGGAVSGTVKAAGDAVVGETSALGNAAGDLLGSPVIIIAAIVGVVVLLPMLQGRR